MCCVPRNHLPNDHNPMKMGFKYTSVCMWVVSMSAVIARHAYGVHTMDNCRRAHTHTHAVHCECGEWASKRTSNFDGLIHSAKPIRKLCAQSHVFIALKDCALHHFPIPNWQLFAPFDFTQFNDVNPHRFLFAGSLSRMLWVGCARITRCNLFVWFLLVFYAHFFALAHKSVFKLQQTK